MEQRKVLLNGELVIKTDEGIYFHALPGSQFPMLIDKEEGERLWAMEDKKGLYNKYTVINNETGKEIDGPSFILRPDRDPAALQALRIYAIHSKNEALSRDIMGWIRAEKAKELSKGAEG